MNYHDVGNVQREASGEVDVVVVVRKLFGKQAVLNDPTKIISIKRVNLRVAGSICTCLAVPTRERPARQRSPLSATTISRKTNDREALPFEKTAEL